MTALTYAVTSEYYCLDELLDAGRDLNIEDKTGNTTHVRREDWK